MRGFERAQGGSVEFHSENYRVGHGNSEERVASISDLGGDWRTPDSHKSLTQKNYSEFFAGIGLMRLGLEKMGWSIAFANDIDPQKYEMYKGHFPDADSHYHVGDIHEIPCEDVPPTTLATASFPCNDLSLAGPREGLRGKQSSAFWGFIRILKEMGSRRPPLVLIENVPGFLSCRRGRDLAEALLALNAIGYSVDAFVLDAADFVPQSRQRLFIVGIHEPKVPRNLRLVPAFAEGPVRPKLLADFMLGHPDIKWRIRNLPVPPTRDTSLTDIIEDLPSAAPEWWSEERSSYLLKQMSQRHRRTAAKMILGQGWSYGTVFRRVRNGKSMAELRTDNVAGCLRTPRGGSGRQILLKAGKGKYFARLLTPRECARLMGADGFHISATLNQALFGFGDAVCVPVVEWIAKYYLNPLVSELVRERDTGFCSTGGQSSHAPARQSAKFVL